MADGNGEAAKRWLGMFALGRDDENMASGELNYHPQTGITLRTLDWVPTEDIQHRDPIRQYQALKRVIEGTRPCTILHAFETNVGGGRLEQSELSATPFFSMDFAMIRQLRPTAECDSVHPPSPLLPVPTESRSN